MLRKADSLHFDHLCLQRYETVLGTPRTNYRSTLKSLQYTHRGCIAAFKKRERRKPSILVRYNLTLNY